MAPQPEIAKLPRLVKARTSETDARPQLQDGRNFPGNKIRSTKYTVLNFLPKSFALQFTRLANVFYLVNAVLQSIPSISTNDPLATIIPLCYVVLMGMYKEFYADYKRYKNDKVVN